MEVAQAQSPSACMYWAARAARNPKLTMAEDWSRSVEKCQESPLSSKSKVILLYVVTDHVVTDQRLA